MMFVLDSNALLAVLRGEKGASEVLALINSGANLFVHSVNLIEVFYDLSRSNDVLFARTCIEQFTQGDLIERTDMDAAFREDVAQLKADWRRISLADCCGLALARRLDAEFVTADHHEMDVLKSANIAKIRFFR